MISFLLNEWRTNLNNRHTEKEVLTSLKDNLAQDTTMILIQKKIAKYGIEAADKLLYYEDLSDLEDSLDFYLDVTLSYTMLPIADVAYEELKQANVMQHIKNKELLNSIVRQHTFYYPMVKEWNDIDKNFILNRMLPYVDENFPNVDMYYYSQMLPDRKRELHQLLQEDEFKNLVRSNKVFKSAISQILDANLNNVRALLLELEEELN